jgi:hypothetical protein
MPLHGASHSITRDSLRALRGPFLPLIRNCFPPFRPATFRFCVFRFLFEPALLQPNLVAIDVP